VLELARHTVARQEQFRLEHPLLSDLPTTGRAKVRIFCSENFRYSGIAMFFKSTFDVFTRVSPDNSLERLTERSVGLVTNRSSDVYELFVTLL